MSTSLSLRSFALLFFLSVNATAQRTKLSIPLADEGDVMRYEVSPDGERAVYTARQGPSAPHQLFSVGVRDAASKLLDPGSCGTAFAVSPAGRVVYVFHPTLRIRSVPLDGSAAPIELGMAGEFDLSPDGAWVLFRTVAGLWVVPADGSAPAALLHAAATGSKRVFTPDGTRVLYVVSLGSDPSSGRLYVARLDRSTPPLALNDGTTRCSTDSFLCSPDTKWVVYRGGSRLPASRRLYSVPIDGSAPPVQLNLAVPGGSFLIFLSFNGPQFSPDGKRVVYQVDPAVEDLNQLFSVPVDGSSPPIELNAPLPPGGQVLYHQLTQDGMHALYLAAQEDAERFELYSVPILGGTPRKLSRPGENVGTLQVSPDGRHVAYLADPEGGTSYRIFLASLVPGPPVIPLSDPVLTPEFPVPSMLQFDGTGRRVAFLTLEPHGNGFLQHLHVVQTSGLFPAEPLDLAGFAGAALEPVVYPGLESYWMRYAAGDSLAVYLADLERDGVVELWASPLAKRGFGRR